MPFIQKKFPTYKGYAGASIEDIFGSESIISAYTSEATIFKSVALINKGEWQFEIIELPWQAQMFPILDAETFDQNNDGLEDLIIVGNIYNTEVETPRLDSNSGLILYSDGERLHPGFSLNIPGNVKSVELKKFGNTHHLIVGKNNDFMVSYSIE